MREECLVNRWRASGYVLLGAACYGTISTITKLAFERKFTPAEIASGQVAFGCLILWLISLFMWRKYQHLEWKTTALLILAGSVWGLTEVFYTTALSKIPASIAVILLFQFIWMSQVVQMVQEKSWLSKERWLSLISVLFGSFCASGFSSQDLNKLDTLGLVLGLCAAISYTASMFVSDTVAVDVHPVPRSTLMVTGQMLFVFLIYPPVFLFNGSMERGLWLWIGLLGIIGVVFTNLTYNIGIPIIGTGLAGIFGTIELPMVLLLSTLVLNEAVSATQWIGAGFIILGVILTSLNKNKASSTLTN
jgi:drug/metabolite transporter (DMT)-like permease